MKRTVHVHIHRGPTVDNKWEESKHPRKDDGKFGTGSGDKKENRESLSRAPASPDKKMNQADAFKAGKEEMAKAEKGEGSYTKAAEFFDLANEPGRADHARRTGKDKGEGAKAAPAAKKISKADALAKAKVLEQDALKDEANFHDAAEMYEAAGKPDKVAAMNAMARRQGHEKGVHPLAKHQIKTRHEEKHDGVPEGDSRPGGPLKRGEIVKIVSGYAQGDTREYVVVASESKGRVDITPKNSTMALPPREVIDGYMVQRHQGSK